MSTHEFFKLLNDNQGPLAALAILIGLAATYFKPSFDKKKKEFSSRLDKKIYPTILNLYHKYNSETRADRVYGNYVSIQDYMRWNGTISNLHKSYRIVYTNRDVKAHTKEIEFFDWLEEKNVIKGYYSSAMSKMDGTFLYHEYILTPSISSWDKVEKKYRKSSEYKLNMKLNDRIKDAFMEERKIRFAYVSSHDFSEEILEFNKLNGLSQPSNEEEKRLDFLRKELFKEEHNPNK